MDFDLNQVTDDGTVLYSNYANAVATPNRLALVARLHGLSHASLGDCRVLELGCADGGNLLPLAEAMPQASFVGVDLRPEHLQEVRRVASELGLENIELLAEDMRQLDGALGDFDYILCHGVFSWVDPDVQDKILQLCRTRLKADGLAYVNFSTLPGSMFSSMLRDYLRLTIDHDQAPSQRVAAGREALGLLQDAWASQQGCYADALQEQVSLLATRDDGFLFHAYLDVPNMALTFGDFLLRLKQHQMNYVADLGWPFLARECGVGAWNQRIPSDPLLREQVLDYLENRGSRRSLICRSSQRPARPLAAGSLDDLHVVCFPTPTAPPSGAPAGMQAYLNEYGVPMATKDPRLVATFDWLLHRRLPATVHQIKTAIADTQVPADTILNTLEVELVSLASGRFLQLSVTPPAFAPAVPDQPQIRPFARHQLRATGKLTTTLRHEVVQVAEHDRQVMLLLDGQRNAESIAEQLGWPVSDVGEALDRLRKSSLLLG